MVNDGSANRSGSRNQNIADFWKLIKPLILVEKFPRNEGIWSTSEGADFIERYISLLCGLFFENAFAHGDRTKLSQLTLFPSGYSRQETSSWEQRKFSELATLRRGLTYSPANIRPYGQGVRVLRSSNIAEDEFVLSREDVFVDEDVVKMDLAQDDEILITAANGSPRLVGKRAKIHDLAGKTVHGGFMLCARAEQPDFVVALMGSQWYQRFLATGVAGGNGSIGNLDKEALENETALIPRTEEQRLIGAHFSRLDALITLHQRESRFADTG